MSLAVSDARAAVLRAGAVASAVASAASSVVGVVALLLLSTAARSAAASAVLSSARGDADVDECEDDEDGEDLEHGGHLGHGPQADQPDDELSGPAAPGGAFIALLLGDVPDGVEVEDDRSDSEQSGENAD